MVCCTYCKSVCHNISKCNELSELINNTELWAMYSVIQTSDDSFIAHLHTLDIEKLLTLIAHKKGVSSTNKEIMVKNCVNAYISPYYNEIRDTREISSWLRYSQYLLFVNRNNLMHDTKNIFHILSESGMKYFRNMFGESFHITDIINITNIESPTSLISMPRIIEIIGETFAQRIYYSYTINRDIQNIEEIHDYDTLYTIISKRIIDIEFHADLRDFIRAVFTREIHDEIYNSAEGFIEVVLLDEMESDYGDEDEDGDEDEYYEDIILPQEINVEFKYDNHLILYDEECFICCNAQCDTQLGCNHILCGGCIHTLIANAKVNHTVKLVCPFCKRKIESAISNREQNT